MEALKGPQADLYLVAAVIEAAGRAEEAGYIRDLADTAEYAEGVVSPVVLGEVLWVYDLLIAAVTTDGPIGRGQMEIAATRGAMILAQLAPASRLVADACWAHLHLHPNGVLHATRVAAGGWLVCEPARTLSWAGEYLVLPLSNAPHELEAPLMG